MPNLKSRAPLTTAEEMAELYVVYNNKDYRITLGTLISIVTKARLGLDRVNNTSDAEKPLSSMMLDALNMKADKSTVVTTEAFDALVNQISTLVTLDQLNAAIQSVLDAVNSGGLQTQIDDRINAALTPINAALGTINATLSSHATRLTAIENSSSAGVSRLEFTAGLQNLYTTVENNLTAMREEFNDELFSIRQQMALLSQAQAALMEDFNDHKHTASDITDLQSFVVNLINENGAVIVGPNDW